MLFAMTPKMATPTADPIERANWPVPVTTPRSCQGTELWAAMTEEVEARPLPAPMTKHEMATAATEGVCAKATSLDEGT
jgi:hypothetical protein